jgi:hypothetical protein
MKYLCIIMLCLLLTLGCSKLRNPEEAEGESCMQCHNDLLGPHLLPKLMSDSAYAYDCSICHIGYSRKHLSVDPENHQDGISNVDFNTDYLHDVFTYSDEIGFENGNCSNIPCHGNGRMDLDSLQGADEKGKWVKGRDSVIWHVDVKLTDTLDCMGCHNTAKHRAEARCQSCHNKGTIIDSVTLDDYSMHINGRAEYSRDSLIKYSGM